MAIIFKIFSAKADFYIRLFLLAPILFIALPTIAQPDVKNTLHSAYKQYLNFQLDSCSANLENVPPSPASFYLEILLESTRIFVEDDFEKYKARKYLETEMLVKLEKLNFPVAHTNFLKSEIKLQWAILKLKNGEVFSSFWSLKQAFNIAKANVSENPDFLPSYKTLGLLHVLYGIFPDKHNWILSIFGIEGNVKRGLSELEKVYKSTDLLSTESGMTIALLNAYLLNAPEIAADIMGEIHGNRRQLLIDYSYALILVKNSESERALEVIHDAELVYPQPFLLPQLYYVKAEALLQKGFLNEAIENYQMFLARHTGNNLVKDTYYKIGICHLIQGLPNLAEKYFEASRQKGWAKNEADKNAEKSLDSNHFSPKDLYQLRYATDGGYYEKALKIHGEIDTLKLNDQDKCEYYYRSARLYHKNGNMEIAIKSYKKTIKSQKNRNWYFAPNSALQLGLIYLKKNNADLAIKYLDLVNDYTDYPYQTSIRQKAKATRKELN